ATTDAWLTGVYQSVLGRTPDAGGLVTWRQVVQGSSRDDVALDILNSMEALDRVVTRTYQEVLGRLPDAPGKTAWIALLGQGLPLSGFLAGLASSPEFIGRVAGGVLDVPTPPAPGLVVEPQVVPVVPVDSFVVGVDDFGFDSFGFDGCDCGGF